MLIEGIFVPLTAPFYRDGSSYLRKLEHNVARYSMTPAAGLVALAMEIDELNDAEIAETLRTVAQTAAKEKVLIASIARNSTRETLVVAEQAAKEGFDVALLSAPPNWRWLTAAERMLSFRAVADRSPLPVMLLSGGVPGFALLATEVAELAMHPNVIGMVNTHLIPRRYHEIADATKDVRREVTVTSVFAAVTGRMLAAQPPVPGSASFVTAESLAGGAAVAVAPPKPAIKTRTKTVGFQVLDAGPALGMVDVLEAGSAGAIPTLAACAPQACYEVFAAFKDGDPVLAREKEERLLEADWLLRREGIAAVKHGCDWNGYYGGAPRLPRLPLNDEQRRQLEHALQGLRN